MGNLRNILVVIEIKQLRQPALERGIALYNYAMAHNKKEQRHDDVKIIAVLPIAQEPWNLTSFLAVDKTQFEKAYKKKQERWLKAYLSVNAMGVKIETKVIFSREVGKDLVDIAKENCCDILIKTAEIHGLFAGGAGPLLGPASSVSEISAPGGQLLFLYVLEAGVYRADPVFHSGQLFLRPVHPALSRGQKAYAHCRPDR